MPSPELAAVKGLAEQTPHSTEPGRSVTMLSQFSQINIHLRGVHWALWRRSIIQRRKEQLALTTLQCGSGGQSGTQDPCGSKPCDCPTLLSSIAASVTLLMEGKVGLLPCQS